jgi:endonuclease YncB( thermonuclease family)
MFQRFIILAVLFSAAFHTTVVQAAKCSGGAFCNACTNCSSCGHCGKGGGTCSVCRPDLYRQSSYTPPRTYTPPRSYTPPRVYTPPTYSAPSVSREPAQPTRPRRVTVTVPGQFSGKVIGVSDGDTIKVLYQGRYPVTIRLYGIDTPESRQAFGTQAKLFTSQSTFGKTVTVYNKGGDRYGRTLGWVFVGKSCVNTELVRNGLAWWYRQYSPNEAKLRDLEVQARARRVGLWRDTNPVAPWQWRRSR